MGECGLVGRERPEIRYVASKRKGTEDRTNGVFERRQRIDWTVVQEEKNVTYMIITREKRGSI